MKTLRIVAALSAAVLAVSALPGCMAMNTESSGRTISTSPASGVEGEWNSTDGVAISRFSGGVFTTNATDTGNKLADGSYRMVDPKNVEITVISLIRNTTTNVNCSLVTSNQLNCTSSAGQNFVLTRRA